MNSVVNDRRVIADAAVAALWRLALGASGHVRAGWSRRMAMSALRASALSWLRSASSSAQRSLALTSSWLRAAKATASESALAGGGGSCPVSSREREADSLASRALWA